MPTLVKETIYVELAYNFRGLVQGHHGGARDSMQANMILKKKIRILHSELQGSIRVSHWAWFWFLKPENPPSVVYFLQQCHLYSNKTLPNSSHVEPFPDD